MLRSEEMPASLTTIKDFKLCFCAYKLYHLR
jgi:hypothetical protein